MIKVLYLEDTPAQSRSLRNFLSAVPMDFEFMVAQNKTACRGAIQQFRPDIVLCPVSLPWITIYEAENLLAKASRAIPFILLTDTLTEATAEQIIKAGADDCIRLEHLGRLPAAMLNAVEKYRFQMSEQVLLRQVQHKIRRSCEEAERASATLQLATEAAHIALWEQNLHTGEMTVAEDFYATLGLTTVPAGVPQRNWLQYVHPSDTGSVLSLLESAQKGQDPSRTEFRLKVPNNTIRYLSGIARLQAVPQGTPKLLGTLQDITEVKQAQQNLQASEFKYHTLFENSMDAILIAEPAGRILSANAMACQIFQRSEEELCRTERLSLMVMNDHLARLLAERQAKGHARGEVTLIRKDGTHFPAEVTSGLFLDAFGRKRSSLIIRDLTKKKFMEAALQKEKQQYIDLFKEAPSCLAVLRMPQFVFEMANPLFLQVTGRKDIVGQPLQEVFCELLAQGVLATLKELVQQEKPFSERELPIRIDREGQGNLTELYFDLVCTPQKNHEGKVEFLYIFANDVTDKVLLRKKAEEREKNYRALFYHSPFPKLLIDQESQGIVMANNAALELYGYSKEDLKQMTLAALNHPGFQTQLSTNLNTARYSDRIIKCMGKQLKASGEEMIVEIHAVRFEYNSRPCFLIVASDLTEQIFMQNNLAELKVMALKKITRAQIKGQEKEREHIGRELHDNVNQQLCTVNLLLSLVQENPAQEHLLSRSIQTLQTAINDIRVLCKSLIPPTLKDIGLLASLKELFASFGQAHHFRLHFREAGFVDTIDEELQLSFFRIIQEQLTNIAKHAAAQNVWITFGQEQGQIELQIRDDGVGFDPAAKRKGIGLLNMKNRLELFGGTLKVLSSPGRGCTLHIKVPTKVNYSSGPGNHLNIIVAEDDLLDQELIQTALDDLHTPYQVQFVLNGKELLDLLNKLPDDELPALLIIDYNMPVLNGYATLKSLKKVERYKNITKVVYSTSYYKQQETECLLEDAKAYIKKGITNEEIKANIREILSYCLPPEPVKPQHQFAN